MDGISLVKRKIPLTDIQHQLAQGMDLPPTIVSESKNLTNRNFIWSLDQCVLDRKNSSSIVILYSRHASRTFQRNFLGVEGELLKKNFLMQKVVNRAEESVEKPQWLCNALFQLVD